MSARILVAGVGNVFLSDDGFGVEVIRALTHAPLPETVEVTDYGIRGLHLAYRLLDPPELLIFVDALSRGGAPGTLYLLEPELDGMPQATADAHGMDPATVFALVGTLGGTMPRVRIVGCEPAELGEGMGLSPVVSAAIPGAARRIQALCESELSCTARRARQEVRNEVANEAKVEVAG